LPLPTACPCSCQGVLTDSLSWLRLRPSVHLSLLTLKAWAFASYGLTSIACFEKGLDKTIVSFSFNFCQYVVSHPATVGCDWLGAEHVAWYPRPSCERAGTPWGMWRRVGPQVSLGRPSLVKPVFLVGATRPNDSHGKAHEAKPGSVAATHVTPEDVPRPASGLRGQFTLTGDL